MEVIVFKSAPKTVSISAIEVPVNVCLVNQGSMV